MNAAVLPDELLRKMDAYWRAANYLSVGQIYLYDNPLLKEPLARPTLSRACWGTGAPRPGRTSSTCISIGSSSNMT